MKIVHIAPNAPYNEGWGYQENLLTKYQSKLGHNVSLIITDKTHFDGKIVKTACEDYISPDGFRVIRIKTFKNKYFDMLFGMRVYEALCELKPDFIFFHGLSSFTIFDAIKYKKHHNMSCVIVRDNHLDYNIGVKPDNFFAILYRAYFRALFKLTKKHISKVYGVTPWRKTYAEEFYKVPASMTDVLIMGADDEKIHFDKRNSIRKKIRNEYNISNCDFLIVTGGKISENKKIIELMKATEQFDDVKLLIFGNISDDIKDEFCEIVSRNSNIIYIGWIEADKVYDYFFAADLAFFPGQHSVIWEQACASKLPCVFAKWDGMDHVNNDGNSSFIHTVTVQAIADKITELKFTDKYYKMKSVAESANTDIYLYSKAAEKSLECARYK